MQDWSCVGAITRLAVWHVNLRKYQQTLADSAILSLETHDLIAVVCPTGSGKTALALHGILPRIAGPVAWVTHRTELARQVRDYGADVSVFMVQSCGDLSAFHSIIIDGIADLVVDPNDADECFPLITELHALAIRYDTAIILVLHMNPGSQNEKGRGHLGSQLERKSESNLTLTKDGEATVISSTRQRGRPIPKDDKAPSFRWSDERQMHISCGAVPKEPTGKRGRPEVYPFSIYSPLFPETMAQAMTLTPLAKRLSVNRPISAKQLGNVLERWEKEGAVISADTPHGRVYYKRFQSVTSTAGRT